MKKFTLLATTVTALLINSQSFAQFNSDIKISADIESGCFITANNVNFGVLQMPLTNTSASSDIKIKCSKNSPLVLNVLLNGVSSSSSNTLSVGQSITLNNGYTLTLVAINQHHNYTLHKNNILLGGEGGNLHCSLNGTDVIGGYAVEAGISCSDNYPLYQGNKIFSNASYGELSALTTQEKILYSARVPFNDSLIWSKGINSYNTIGTGEEQTIPLKIFIEKDNNPTHRLSPDNYQSSLTLELNY